LWANEDLINKDTADTLQLPSDIKPGVYILRTELLALHGNAMTSTPSEGSGPQFYIHCFNLDIQGSGTAEPKGVKFPGAYKRTDPGVKFNLYAGGQAAKDNYVSACMMF
jgi:cellulase